jgi:hypothetical protein
MADLTAMAIREWCERTGTSLTEASAMVAARFGCHRDTAARKLNMAEHSGHMDPEWADRWAVALDLEIVEQGPALPPGLDAYCPGCRQVVASRGDGTCVWCDAQTGGNTVCVPEDRLADRRKESRSRNAGVPYLCTEEDVEEIRRLYLSGLSMRAACAQVWHRTSYTSVTSMAMTMYDLFRWRGWKRRDQRQATAARNYKHGKARDLGHRRRLRRASGEVRGVKCQGVKKNAPGKGKPCQHFALSGKDYCQFHDPEREAQWHERMAAMREKAAA